MSTSSQTGPALAVIVKGYPRLSETFVAQELLGLQERGIDFEIWSLRHPTDAKTHPIHERIRAPRRYLPEYLRHEPLRVMRSTFGLLGRAAFWRAAAIWLRDLRRDPTINRVRRFGQAAVLASELPTQTRFLYVHFLHTPASVARYAAEIRGLKWGFAAHAKDIWTTPDWEKREKIAACDFGVTCTAVGADHLQSLAPRKDRVSLVYHGLDLSRFPPPPEQRSPKTGADAVVEILSVGRLVEKKGYSDLLTAAAALPADLNWRFVHIGGGPLKDALRDQAQELGLTDRIEWRGAQEQTAVIEALRQADLFVLPSLIAADGDRDGLPNVLMEAASQKLPIISTEVSAIPEFITDPSYGSLIPPGDPEALAAALAAAMRDPTARAAMADRLYNRLVADFGAQAGFDAVAQRIAPHLPTDAQAQVAAEAAARSWEAQA